MSHLSPSIPSMLGIFSIVALSINMCLYPSGISNGDGKDETSSSPL